ncbi:variant surface glycoprotein (VSG), putative [Trypanosoma brucei brucei TREU927]|uniref:Variant surface glycoprotein (VSG), putative n=1 Tax=Trypanosoma brucei brucei (strain 927/4 GUTat10.1) TaxID=185431 RepID=Q580P0_TRYB2|nr:variant surface glycoprotein (VSG), putative [Trypanosoma brucei brucei TREU927]AAX79144.1 variant surface glycoprotein (VSG), putative [Trypanosoma brucei]AAZ11134.1 variant surface glycoprotein (VSG), putative [Trypanosoma brucei brucei TREU927]
MIGQWSKIFLIALALTSPALASFQADNAADLQLLCTAIALDGAEPTKLTTADSAETTIKHARALNMSAADETWQEIFVGGKSKNSWEAKKQKVTGEPFKSHWEADYDKWVEDKETVDSGTGQSKWLTLNPRPASAPALQAAAEKINSTLRQLLKQQAALETATTEATETYPNEAKDELIQALYGTGVTQPKFTDGKTIKHAATYANGCAKNAGLSIYGDVMCICGTQSADTSDQCADPVIAIKWSGGNDQSVISQLKAKCKTLKPAEYTAGDLEALVQRIVGRVRSAKGAGNDVIHYLGKVNLGTCTGANSQACAIYASDSGKHSAITGGLNIPWLNHLAKAAKALRKAEAAAKNTETSSKHIKILADAIQTAYSATRYNMMGKPAAAQTETQSKKTDGEDGKQHHCKQKTNQTKEECKKLGCDHDEKENKCKPKAGTEDKVAGTGDATTPNCASHTEKTKCEAENTGKSSPVCGWRKGKDGETEPEKEKCRSSSFLLNKKFALSMVSAAFVALLF